MGEARRRGTREERVALATLFLDLPPGPRPQGAQPLAQPLAEPVVYVDLDAPVDGWMDADRAAAIERDAREAVTVAAPVDPLNRPRPRPRVAVVGVNRLAVLALLVAAGGVRVPGPG